MTNSEASNTQSNKKQVESILYRASSSIAIEQQHQQQQNTTAQEHPVSILQIMKAVEEPTDTDTVTTTNLVSMVDHAVAAQPSIAQQQLLKLQQPVVTTKVSQVVVETPPTLSAFMTQNNTTTISVEGSSKEDNEADAQEEAAKAGNAGNTGASVTQQMKKISAIFGRKKNSSNKKDKKKSKKDKSKSSKTAAVIAAPTPLETNTTTTTTTAPVVDANSLAFPTMTTPTAAAAEQQPVPTKVLESHYFEETAVSEADTSGLPGLPSSSMPEDTVAAERQAADVILAMRKEELITRAEKAALMVEESLARMVLAEEDTVTPEDTAAVVVEAPVIDAAEVEQPLGLQLDSTPLLPAAGIKKTKSATSKKTRKKKQGRRTTKNNQDEVDDIELGDEIAQLYVCCQEEVQHLVNMLPNMPEFFKTATKGTPCDPTNMVIPSNSKGCAEIVTSTLQGAANCGADDASSPGDDVSVLTEDNYEKGVANMDDDGEIDMVVVSNTAANAMVSEQGTRALSPMSADDIVDRAFARDEVLQTPVQEETPVSEEKAPEEQAPTLEAAEEPKEEEDQTKPVAEEESPKEAEDATPVKEAPKQIIAVAPIEEKKTTKKEKKQKSKKSRFFQKIAKATIPVGTISEIPTFGKAKKAAAPVNTETKAVPVEVKAEAIAEPPVNIETKAAPVEVKPEANAEPEAEAEVAHSPTESTTEPEPETAPAPTESATETAPVTDPVEDPVEAPAEVPIVEQAPAQSVAPAEAAAPQEDEIILKSSQTVMSGLTNADNNDDLHLSPLRNDRSTRNSRQLSSTRQDIDNRDDGLFRNARDDKTIMTFKSTRTGRTGMTGRSRRTEGQMAEKERMRSKRRHAKNSNTAPGNDEIERARLQETLSQGSSWGAPKGDAYPLLDEQGEDDGEDDEYMTIRPVATDKSVDLEEMIRDALQRADRTLSMAYETTTE